MERWVGKVAVITGASSGIGASIAEKFVEAGLIVIGLARRPELIEANALKLASKPGKLYPYQADLTKEDDIIKAIDWTTKNHGPIHILVNNAGILVGKNLLDGATSDWRRLLETNVLALCIATREAVKNMMESKVDGHIIHINSVSGHKDYAGLNIYGASKHAVKNLTEVLRQELNAAKSKIKISSVSPGIVKTSILDVIKMPEQFKNPPELEVEDVANAVMYVIGTPPHVQIHELMIKPIGELF